MRVLRKNKDLSVFAIAGTHSVHLGMNASPKAAKGLLGFAIHREDHSEDEAYWLSGLLSFQATDKQAAHHSLLVFR